MSRYVRRKRLRDRVAARQSGQSEYEKTTPEAKWRIRLRWAGILAQAIAIFLLIIEVVRLINANFEGASWTQLAIYSGLFFSGRIIQLVLKFV